MSETRDILTGVIASRAMSFSDPVRNLRTGRIFAAEIEPVPDIEASALLGRDARESTLFHVADRAAAAEIQLQDAVQALGARFRILRRTDNPATTQVEFGAMKLTPQDQ